MRSLRGLFYNINGVLLIIMKRVTGRSFNTVQSPALNRRHKAWLFHVVKGLVRGNVVDRNDNKSDSEIIKDILNNY